MTVSTSTQRKKRTKAKKVVSKAATKKTAAKTKTAKKATSKKAVAKTTNRKITGAKTSTRKKSAAVKPANAKPAAKKAGKKKTTAGKKTSRRSRANVVSGPGLGSTYKSRSGEPYMSKTQLEHFRQKLLVWKEEIMSDLTKTMTLLKGSSSNPADPNDRATQESEFALELRTRDRERKLLKKIAQALARIQDGSYGYCEETGDEIGIARLEIRPVATLCVEAQERRERTERQFVDYR